jgi:hypothetical protein
VRPARGSGTVSFGGTRTSSSPTASSCRSSQPVSCRQSSTAHNRAASSPAAQLSSSPLPTEITLSASGRPAASTATAVTGCLCTSSPITIICIASMPLGATGERTDLNRGRRPRSYQFTLDGLGRRRRHNAAKSDLTGRHSESNQPPPTESPPATGRRHSGDDDIEFRNDA